MVINIVRGDPVHPRDPTLPMTEASSPRMSIRSLGQHTTPFYRLFPGSSTALEPERIGTKRPFRSSNCPIVKYGLRGRGGWDDLLQRTHSETRERKATLARLVPYGCKGSSPSHHLDLISYLK